MEAEMEDLHKRKLVTIRKIDALNPIEGADAIEVATVGGWKVVVKKGEFVVGDDAVYLEIDSWVPHNLAPFLSKGREPRVYEGVVGEKLRTVRLRGQVSQGLLLPLTNFSAHELGGYLVSPETEARLNNVEFNRYKVDLAPFLGVKKWEPAISPQMAGQVKGAFPSFIQKTDQPRCQNLVAEIFSDLDARYEVTIKLDGTSFTAYHYNDGVGVCSRNLELKVSEENKDNTLVKTFHQCGLHHSLPAMGNIAIQGELIGEGIQGNREGLKGHALFVFDAQHLDTGEYLTPAERVELMSKLSNKVHHVPVLYDSVSLRELGITDIEQLLKFAEGPSLKHPVREGLVFKRLDGKFSFKVISTAYLLKEKD